MKTGTESKFPLKVNWQTSICLVKEAPTLPKLLCGGYKEPLCRHQVFSHDCTTARCLRGGRYFMYDLMFDLCCLVCHE